MQAATRVTSCSSCMNWLGDGPSAPPAPSATASSSATGTTRASGDAARAPMRTLCGEQRGGGPRPCAYRLQQRAACGPAASKQPPRQPHAGRHARRDSLTTPRPLSLRPCAHPHDAALWHQLLCDQAGGEGALAHGLLQGVGAHALLARVVLLRCLVQQLESGRVLGVACAHGACYGGVSMCECTCQGAGLQDTRWHARRVAGPAARTWGRSLAARRFERSSMVGANVSAGASRCAGVGSRYARGWGRAATASSIRPRNWSSVTWQAWQAGVPAAGGQVGRMGAETCGGCQVPWPATDKCHPVRCLTPAGPPRGCARDRARGPHTRACASPVCLHAPRAQTCKVVGVR